MKFIIICKNCGRVISLDNIYGAYCTYCRRVIKRDSIDEDVIVKVVVR